MLRYECAILWDDELPLAPVVETGAALTRVWPVGWAEMLLGEESPQQPLEEAGC